MNLWQNTRRQIIESAQMLVPIQAMDVHQSGVLGIGDIRHMDSTIFGPSQILQIENNRLIN